MAAIPDNLKQPAQMAFPKVPEFESLLSSFTFTKPSQEAGFRQIIVAPERGGNLPGGEITVFPEISLWLVDTGKTSWDAFCRRLGLELKKHNHPVSTGLLASIAAIVTFMKDEGKHPIETINHFIQCINLVDVSHFFLFHPCPMRAPRVEWKGFTFGEIDLNTLAYRCRRAGSNYFELHGNTLHFRDGLESPVRQQPAIDFVSFLQTSRPETKDKFLHRLVLQYFNELSDIYRKQMWNELDETQHLFSLFGADVVDVRSIQNCPFAEMVTIYLHLSKTHRHGYVVPTRSGMFLHMLGGDNLHLLKAQDLEKRYSLSDFKNTELHQTIKTFARFTHLALRAQHEQRTSEAFLYCIIALEMVFSEKESATSSVSSRVALITHRKFGNSLDQMRKDMARLYDVRSKFVHRGIPVEETAVFELKEIVVEVFSCLLRLQLRPENHTDEFLKSWLKKLDWLVAGMEANAPLDTNALAECGIE